MRVNQRRQSPLDWYAIDAAASSPRRCSAIRAARIPSCLSVFSPCHDARQSSGGTQMQRDLQRDLQRDPSRASTDLASPELTARERAACGGLTPEVHPQAIAVTVALRAPLPPLLLLNSCWDRRPQSTYVPRCCTMGGLRRLACLERQSCTAAR